MDKIDLREKGHMLPPSGTPVYGDPEKAITVSRKKPNILINIGLFILTVGTTLVAGAMQQGVNPMEDPAQIIKGWPFSAALLFILLSHEMGHYLTSKKYHIDATLPYFIPAPNLIGTFGAVIRMNSPVRNKRVLFDIGAAGPLAGIIVTLPILIAGLIFSEVKMAEAPVEGQFALGTSLLLSFLTKVILGNLPDNYHVMLHPLGFAGWIGLLVTSLNLMPVGQLDGGHIAYAVFGRKKAEMLSRAVVAVLLGLGIWGTPMWLVWALLLIFLLGIKHPPTVDHDVPLDKKRKVVGVITLLIFVATFVPVPFSGM
jgi:membrane-associated protease RseP (regulator of RpoE activity)